MGGGRGNQLTFGRHFHKYIYIRIYINSVCISLCMCVCVCVRRITRLWRLIWKYNALCLSVAATTPTSSGIIRRRRCRRHRCHSNACSWEIWCTRNGTHQSTRTVLFASEVPQSARRIRQVHTHRNQKMSTVTAARKRWQLEVVWSQQMRKFA